MNIIKKIISNRNFVLILALFSGLTIGDLAHYIKDYTFYILALVLSFSTSGIVLSEIKSKKDVGKSILLGILLNYVIFGLVLFISSYYLSINDAVYKGFVVIIATPPGVAIIPFSYLLKGNIQRATMATLAGFIASVFLAPFIIKTLTNNDQLSAWKLFMDTFKIVIIPIIISRFLLMKPIKEITVKIRGKIVNWGFALIIFTAVGINRNVFLGDISILLNVSLILFISIFILGQLYDIISQKMGINDSERITQNLILTLKSSGFSVVIAMSLFGGDASIPPAVLSVFVLLYLLFLSFKQWFQNRAKQL